MYAAEYIALDAYSNLVHFLKPLQVKFTQ